MKINVLVVENREEMREFVAWLLVLEQAEVVAVGDGVEALVQLCCRATPFELVISDTELPHVNGWELLAWVHEWHAELPAARRSVPPPRIFVRTAREDGEPGALPKPFHPARLHEMLGALFDAAGRPYPDQLCNPLTRAA